MRPPLWPVLAFLPLLLVSCQRGKEPTVEEGRDTVTATDPGELPVKYADHNLVLVSFDALQASHVGCLGNPRPVTPHLDALAARSFTFARAMSVASWTVPASMTWFTGVFPSEHRMTNKFAIYNTRQQKTARLGELAPHLMTLAEILKQHGYATGGFTGNAGVNGGFGYEQGFDVYYYDAGRFGSFDQSLPRALDWLRARKGRKFFLFLHGYDIHGQFMPAGGYTQRFVDPGYDRKYTGSPQEQEALREEGLARGFVTLRDADVRYWRAIYDEKIALADAKFGTFLREFDKLDLGKRTLFVLTSDHGTELYEHRRFDHGYSLYQEQIHVPLFIHLPGQTTGKVVNDQVSSIDVMPTILDLLDVPVPEKASKQLRGSSLVRAMQGEPVDKDVFSETDYRQYTYKRAILAPDGWKLMYTLEDRTKELFDLNTDPAETTNLLTREPGRAAALEQRLFAHFASLGQDLKGQNWKVGLNPVYPSQAKGGAK